MKPGSRLLIVDDHLAFRNYLKEITSKRFPHVTVEEAGDEDENLAKISDSKPHLVLMDLGLQSKKVLSHINIISHH
jgi:DNA-binding NarL/FixJ family response regulator